MVALGTPIAYGQKSRQRSNYFGGFSWLLWSYYFSSRLLEEQFVHGEMGQLTRFQRLLDLFLSFIEDKRLESEYE
jgi:hypothetical protein